MNRRGGTQVWGLLYSKKNHQSKIKKGRRKADQIQHQQGILEHGSGKEKKQIVKKVNQVDGE